MDLSLTGRGQRLFELLIQIPPDFAAAEVLLKQDAFSSEEITQVAINYAEACFLDISDTFRADQDDRVSFSGVMPPTGVIPGLHSTYI